LFGFSYFLFTILTFLSRLINIVTFCQVLALSNNSIGNAGIEALAAALTSSTSAVLANAPAAVVGSPLESLALGGNPFSDAGATALASALVNATALRTLRCVRTWSRKRLRKGIRHVQ
jgi:hypothetical protein